MQYARELAAISNADLELGRSRQLVEVGRRLQLEYGSLFPERTYPHVIRGHICINSVRHSWEIGGTEVERFFGDLVRRE